MTTPEKKTWNQKISNKAKVALAGTVIAAIFSVGTGAGCQTNQADKPAIVTEISGETLPPRLPSSNWLEIPQNKIADYATIPDIVSNFIDKEKYLSTISPSLQEKARSAEYAIIYQRDPDDTTGRTIVANNHRQTDGEFNQGSEDLGFGENPFTVKGVFKAWVTKPTDPQQKSEVYALLENPLTKKDYLIDIKLGTSDSTSTYFAVDNLNIGYKDVLAWYKKNHNIIETVMLPDDPSKDTKAYYDFPTFNDLLEKKNISLDNIAQPGDYIVARKEVGYKTGTAKDENGIVKINMFVARRFGGTAAWEKEVGIK